MRHAGTVRLETPRLVLRRFREDDAAPAFRNWESDEKVTEFLRWSPCKTLEETRKILQDWMISYAKMNFTSGRSCVKMGRTSRSGPSALWE